MQQFTGSQALLYAALVVRMFTLAVVLTKFRIELWKMSIRIEHVSLTRYAVDLVC